MILRRAARRAFVVGLAALPYVRGARASDGLWAPATTSPVPLDERQLDELERAALHECGAGEGSLRRVAQEVLALKLAGSGLPEPDGVAFAQRMAGEPHPWARAWAASGREPAAHTLLPRLESWLGDPTTTRRCGVASGSERDGTRALVVVAVEALADLAAPLPIRARVGQWLTLDARVQAPARGSKVILLGPDGAPRYLFTSVDRSNLRARFALDRPGAFTVQVMADTAGGPRPVLEASLFADIAPPQAPERSAAPGEDDASATSDDADALGGMLAGSRRAVGQPPLDRDADLDQLARAHSARMKQNRQLAHDAGDGEPDQRLADRGLHAQNAGENVAHATTLVQAHRALWASPSHRINMLSRDFHRMGVGVVRGDGDVWVTEMFVGP